MGQLSLYPFWQHCRIAAAWFSLALGAWERLASDWPPTPKKLGKNTGVGPRARNRFPGAGPRNRHTIINPHHRPGSRPVELQVNDRQRAPTSFVARSHVVDSGFRRGDGLPRIYPEP